MKKVISLVTAACTVMAAVSCGAVSISADTIRGDLNGDNKITLKDASMVQRIVAGLVEPTDAQSYSADFNGDGKVTALDSFMIQKYVAQDAATVNNCLPNKTKAMDLVKLINADRVANGLPEFTVVDANLFAGETRVQEIADGYTDKRPNSRSIWTIFSDSNLSYKEPFQYYGTGSSSASTFYKNIKTNSSSELYSKLMMSKHNTLIVGAMKTGVTSYQWVVVVG